ncbi:enoyl-CoA hydratase [Rhodococcus hoagii]|nr:enoyl-CoA hydratase [Prescottella equi]
MISLDSGNWCFAAIVGKRRCESGVRVQLLKHDADEKVPTFTVAAANSGDGFAL